MSNGSLQFLMILSWLSHIAAGSLLILAAAHADSSRVPESVTFFIGLFVGTIMIVTNAVLLRRMLLSLRRLRPETVSALR